MGDPVPFPIPPRASGEGDHPQLAQQAKDGGRGAGGDEPLSTKAVRRVRRPFHHLAAQDGPPCPLLRGRRKRYSAASTRFLRLDAAPRASTGFKNCPV